MSRGELATIAPERLWTEFSKGLSEARPSRMFAVLRTCGALRPLLPEVDALFGVPQRPDFHPEIDTGVHLMQALDHAAKRGFALPVRYAVLAHDLGKAATPSSKWPAHHGHEAASVRLAERMSERLRVPLECRDLARLVARWHGNVHRAAELRASTWLDLFSAADALRRPERAGRPGRGLRVRQAVATRRRATATIRRRSLREAFDVLRGVQAGAVATEVVARAAAQGVPAGGEAIAKAVRAARLARLAALETRGARGGADATGGV